MSENEKTSSSERVKEDEYVLKKANQANFKEENEEEEEKDMTGKVDVNEDATSEE